ncbi:nitrilase-related carbon-nitrogen hydrolase [Amaricoccus solimangrovi]|uniref:Amidohydrolase n=1 Tax=Amaricoccus solimangrovi TaxID=2589815 RepID=A0A501WST9_9RHOB|nr:nitrilase-related carbon-nitrogen hydrolase [Amaricoccus solimangrovi]TPE51420.1 amidohydrolase [Amaricoccus solimangrovi]
MKIAAAAYPIDWLNRWNEYVGKIRVWVRAAAENGADLLVFPECAAMELASLARESNAGDPRRAAEAVAARAKDVDELHESLAREFSVHIAAGSAPIHESEALASRTRFFAPDGTMAFQDRQSLSPAERAAGLAPGRGGRVFDTALGKIGILPGRDAMIPALARDMAAAGAEILLVPAGANSVLGYWRVRIAAAARAVETQSVAVLAARVGDSDWLGGMPHHVGAAAILTPPEEEMPQDGVLAAGKMNAEGWVYGDFDPEPLRAARNRRASADPDLRAALSESFGPVETVRLGAARVVTS